MSTAPGSVGMTEMCQCPMPQRGDGEGQPAGQENEQDQGPGENDADAPGGQGKVSRTVYTYTITNTVLNEVVYVGKSVDPEGRWRTHKANVKSIGKPNERFAAKKIHYHIAEYGIENFVFTVVTDTDCEAQLQTVINPSCCVKTKEGPRMARVLPASNGIWAAEIQHVGSVGTFASMAAAMAATYAAMAAGAQ